MERKKVVILGAGYAGLKALSDLQGKGKHLDITIVDRNDYHYEATNLHEVAAGSQPAEKISYLITDVVNPKTTRFLQGTVEYVDTAKNMVLIKNEEPLVYDYLVFSLGFISESFGIPGVEEYSLPMTDIDSAEGIRQHIEAQLESYKETKDPNALKIVVCGAGFTGIELLGALCDEKKRYASLAGVSEDQIEFYCVEATTQLLPMFKEELGEYGVKNLKKWGVTFLVGKPIKEIKEGTVVYQDNPDTKEMGQLEAGTIIWTTGVSGSPVVAASGFPEKRGRVMVNADLTAPALDNVFIIGDCAAVMDPNTNRPYPTTAQISLKMGSAAAKNILLKDKGEATKPFTFTSLGSVCSIGNTHAFGVVGKTSIKGYPASFVKKAIVDRSLLETGGIKELLSKGRFDFYH